ncbi:MAG TPA: sigma-54 dependent transcriptional regulator [Candidatus Polarisedimenticolia bacterium]|nr:sigma-54 dependent transcriptional regulator [Candidatus Polarisedimenticolia bacterium]
MGVLVDNSAIGIARKHLPVCVLDDDPDQVDLFTTRLEQAGFPVVGTSSPQEALQKVRLGGCRVVLARYRMPRMDGLAFLEKTLQYDPGMYVILVSGYYSVDSAIDAVKRGAYDYLCEPIDFRRLERALDDLAEAFSRRAEIRDLEDKLFETLQVQGIVGRSPAMIEVFEMVRKVARHYSNVLIAGPTGAGKELVARALHQLSPVARERFAVCNCSALVDTLLESQLFGHVRGSFTGATDTRPGLFEFSNGGTVFLDEIGETSMSLQSKLLRVIENREIQRVGSPEVRKVDVRLIAATNRDLRTEVLAGRFREDLFYRLSSIEIRVPSLTERPEDIPILVQHFLKKYSQAYGKPFRGLSQRAQIALLQHNWPGNVRELANAISSAAITASADFIDVGDLPEQLRKPHRRAVPPGENWQPLPLEEVRRVHIQRVLEACNGNRVRAAQMLGIGRTSLYRFLKRMDKHAAAAKGAA